MTNNSNPMYLMFYDTLLRWDYSIAYSILKLIPKQNKKNERQFFGNKKWIPNFHIPEILLNLKTTWMIARVPNKIRTHKRATETNFVVEAMSSGFSAPRMSLSFLLSSTLGFSRTGSWLFMWAVRSVTSCSLTFCHVEKLHWVLE